MSRIERDDCAEAQRLDKWLWFARVTRTRTLATRLVTAGKVRVNSEKVTKPSQSIRAGDVLTVTVNRRVRVLKVERAGNRRGPASEAVTLYEDLTPQETGPAPQKGLAGLTSPVRDPGQGRPTKRQRRQLSKLLGRQ